VKPLSSPRRAALAVGVLAVLAVPLTTAAAARTALADPGLPVSPAAYQPGDEVWTDTKSVPTASAAITFVAPDPAAVQVIFTPVRAYQPGDKVWTSNAQVPPPARPDADGCQRVPSSGYIGYDVYGQTSLEYSNYWYWSGSSSNESFSWYIKHNDGSIEAHGTSAGGGGSQSVGANNYYWQVQNTGTDPQAWNACYEVQ
jgi:hypothetical protein